MVTHRGGCHCGDVRFEVEASRDIEAQECNCSMCSLTGYLHLIVPASRFRLLTDPENLAEYRFETGVARHLFCRRCGIKSYYVPRSNPDGFSVNVRCLDASTLGEVTVTYFDGQNWEQHGHELADLSRD